MKKLFKILSEWHHTAGHRKWRKAVLKKCNYKCDITGSKKDLIAHLLEDAANNPELRLKISNGIILTRKLHIMFHCDYKKGYSDPCTKKDYENFKQQYLNQKL